MMLLNKPVIFIVIGFLMILYSFYDVNMSAPDRLRNDVTFLAEIDPPRSYINKGSQKKVAEYIANSLKSSLGNASYQNFMAGGESYSNVLAFYGDTSSERIIIGAHYDVAGENPGADDNASGVAGLLELARMVGESKPDLPYCLEFVAYNLEEPPFFATEEMGSAAHARQIKKTDVRVKLMMCLEMIGYYSDKQDYPRPEFYKLFPSHGNFIAVVGKQGQEKVVDKVHTLMKQKCAIQVEKIAATEALPIAFYSDHRNYLKYGYPAVMIDNTSFLRNKNYHTKNDTPETLDYAKMSEVVKGCYQVITNY